jgi:hypothetical protein
MSQLSGQSSEPQSQHDPNFIRDKGKDIQDLGYQTGVLSKDLGKPEATEKLDNYNVDPGKKAFNMHAPPGTDVKIDDKGNTAQNDRPVKEHSPSNMMYN